MKLYKLVSEYDQEIPQSQTADKFGEVITIEMLFKDISIFQLLRSSRMISFSLLNCNQSGMVRNGILEYLLNFYRAQ